MPLSRTAVIWRSFAFNPL